MIKYWKVLILLVTLCGAILAVGLKPFPYGRTGVKVVFVATDSPAHNLITPGMIITEANSIPVTSANEWASRTFTGRTTIKANGRPITLDVNDSIGINVIDLERTNIDFGIDIQGGTRIILKPETAVDPSVLDETIATLQTRANLFGLSEMKFLAVSGSDGGLIQVEAAGVSGDIIQDLLSRQGKFTAKVTIPATSTLTIGANSYPITINNNSVSVNGTRITYNQTTLISGIPFELVSINGDEALFAATVYQGKDIELVYTDPQHAGLQQTGPNNFRFFFAIRVSADGAQRFADVTAGMESDIDLSSGQEYLSGNILLYLDEDLVSQLRISPGLKGIPHTTPQITGGRPTLEEAQNEKLSLQTILRSGALPTKLKIVSIDVISPTLGKEFLSSAGISVLLAIGLVAFVVFIRYRKLKVAIPMILVSLSEVAIIVGIAAKNDAGIWLAVLAINLVIIIVAWSKKQHIDIFAWSGAILIPLFGMVSWTIDLPAIAGIIAAIGTGVDHQIIIADETIHGQKEEYEIKDTIKRAFFIIFTAAATMIAAMVPLMFIGIGLVRGFAITTIIGIFVGTLITRPAYGNIIERLFKKKE